MFDMLEADPNSVAIVGMAGRFPHAPDLLAFWQLLREGRTVIEDVETGPRSRASSTQRADDGLTFVPRGISLQDAECFDAAFFGYSPAEATEMDPQHRLLLECAYHAVESAGYAPRALPFTTGIYVGCKRPTYGAPEGSVVTATSVEELRRSIANDRSFAAARLAHALNIHGPVLTIDAACSTSLAAVHSACRALVGFECDAALAGAANVTFPMAQGYHAIAGGTFSPDGTCRAFDAEANGTVLGHGVGLVFLRRLADALEAREPILAVILGSAVNNDGASKAGFWTPGVSGQSRVVVTAHQLAGIQADQISYVEAHGMGTRLSDCAEVQALTHAFAASSQRRQYCAIASTKSNLGHMEAAGGIAALMKLVLALQHAQIPPAAAVRSPQPDIDWPTTPFYINRELRPWPANNDGRRIGAVHSFALGGTNAHVIVEQGPSICASVAHQPQLLLVTAATAAQTSALEQQFMHWLMANPDSLADAAFTSQQGREQFANRAFVVINPDNEGLRTVKRGEVTLAPPRTPALTITLLDELAELAEPCRVLYENSATFRSLTDAALLELRPHGPVAPSDLWAGRAWSARERALLACAASYACLMWLRALGMEPAVVISHRIGLLAVAVSRGQLRLSDAYAVLAGSAGALRRQGAGTTEDVKLAELLDPSRWNSSDERVATVLPDASSVHVQWGREVRVHAAGRVDLLHSHGLIWSDILTLLGCLWQRGVVVSWAALHEGAACRRVMLPGYPFTKKTFSLPRTPIPADTSTPDPVAPESFASVRDHLRQLFTRVLGIEDIDEQANFFELGGHSLLALQIAGVLRATYRIEIGPQHFIDHPTVVSLSAWVEAKRILAPGPALPALSSYIGREAISLAQERLWLLAGVEGENGVYNEAHAAVWEGALDREALQRAVYDVLARHDTLRSSFPSENGRPVLRLLAPAAVQAFHFHDLRSAQERPDPGVLLKRARTMLSMEAQRPFDLERGSLLRCVLLRMSDTTHAFALIAHHIIADGLSLALLARELAAHYAYRAHGQPMHLPAPVIQYPAFAAWQRAQLSARNTAPAELWNTQLEGVRALSFPGSAEVASSRKGDVHLFSLGSELVARVDDLARGQGMTRFGVFIALYAYVLLARAQTDSVMVSAPITERTEPELQSLIGMFASSLLVKLTVPANASVMDYLHAAQHELRNAIATGPVAFDALLAAAPSAQTRNTLQRVLDQVRFVYLEQDEMTLKLPELRASPLRLSRRMAKFDLLLTVLRHGDACECELEYRQDLFSAGWIADLVRDFEWWLRAASGSPRTVLAELNATWHVQRARWIEAEQDRLREQRRASLAALKV